MLAAGSGVLIKVALQGYRDDVQLEAIKVDAHKACKVYQSSIIGGRGLEVL